MHKLVFLCGTSGVGKSTLGRLLVPLLPDYACVDTDEVGLDWADYAGTDHEAQFSDDCLALAAAIAGDRHLLFSTCLNPIDFLLKNVLPEHFDAVYFIGLYCSPEALRAHLQARPPEWGCATDAYIAAQTDYNTWFMRNARKLQFHADTSVESPKQTAERIAAFIRALP